MLRMFENFDLWIYQLATSLDNDGESTENIQWHSRNHISHLIKLLIWTNVLFITLILCSRQILQHQHYNLSNELYIINTIYFKKWRRLTWLLVLSPLPPPLLLPNILNCHLQNYWLDILISVVYHQHLICWLFYLLICHFIFWQHGWTIQFRLKR